MADSATAHDILADTHAFLPITECTFLADKDYDVKDIYNKVRKLYDGECIIPLNRRNAKNPKLLPQGNPVCEAGLAIWKDGKFSDNGKTRQKFFYFKNNYSLRTECGRYNSRFKNTGQERMWVRNESFIANLNTLTHISLLAVAVATATVTSNPTQSYRKLKAVKRIA